MVSTSLYRYHMVPVSWYRYHCIDIIWYRYHGIDIMVSMSWYRYHDTDIMVVLTRVTIDILRHTVFWLSHFLKDGTPWPEIVGMSPFFFWRIFCFEYTWKCGELKLSSFPTRRRIINKKKMKKKQHRLLIGHGIVAVHHRVNLFVHLKISLFGYGNNNSAPEIRNRRQKKWAHLRRIPIV